MDNINFVNVNGSESKEVKDGVDLIPLLPVGRLSGNPETSFNFSLSHIIETFPPPLPAWPASMESIPIPIIAVSPAVNHLECKDCSNPFPPPSQKEEQYLRKKCVEHGDEYTPPVRCADCRKEKRVNPVAYKEKMAAIKEERRRLERLERESKKKDRKESKRQSLEERINIVVEDSDTNRSLRSMAESVVNAIYVPPQRCEIKDENPEAKSNRRRLEPFRGVAYRLDAQVHDNYGFDMQPDLPLNYEVPPIYNNLGRLRDPVVNVNCTHDAEGRCAICYVDQQKVADEQKATFLRHAAMAKKRRAEVADRVARHELGYSSSSSDSSGGSSSSSSSSSGSELELPPDDEERPIRVINYEGHYMFDNYENRNKTSKTRVFEVPQACFHGIMSAGIHSSTDLVSHYGFYYKTRTIMVEMPVSIVNELKPFWTTAKARDKLNYDQSKFRVIHLLRNIDSKSLLYRNSVLYAPLLAFWETEAEDRGTNAIVNDKLWSWNYCFLLLFFYAFMEYLLFNRAFNPFWVSLLFVCFVALRFGVSTYIETEFMRFSRVKLSIICLFGALYWFWFMLLTAATYTWQPTETTIVYPFTTFNSSIIWTEKSVYYSNIGVYEGSAVFPLTLTCVLLIVYNRMTQLYAVNFLTQDIHFRDDHQDWHIPILGWRQVHSILSLSVFFAFVQMMLIYLYAPYWLGFFLYLALKWVNRKLSGFNIPHNYRILLIDVQFY